MATINLGRIKLVNKGVWASGTTYAIDDFVQYTDSGVVSTYIAVAASTGQTPSTSVNMIHFSALKNLESIIALASVPPLPMVVILFIELIP